MTTTVQFGICFWRAVFSVLVALLPSVGGFGSSALPRGRFEAEVFAAGPFLRILRIWGGGLFVRLKGFGSGERQLWI